MKNHLELTQVTAGQNNKATTSNDDDQKLVQRIAGVATVNVDTTATIVVAKETYLDAFSLDLTEDGGDPPVSSFAVQLEERSGDGYNAGLVRINNTTGQDVTSLTVDGQATPALTLSAGESRMFEVRSDSILEAADSAAPDSIGNSELNNGAAWVIKARNAGTSGNFSDVIGSDLTGGTPASGTKFLAWVSGTTLRSVDYDDLPGGSLEGTAVLSTGESAGVFLTADGDNSSSWKTVEGTEVASTGEAGGTKFLREDGDGTCSWQTVTAGSVEGTAVLSTGEVGGTKFLREDGDGTCSWQAVPGGGDALTTSPLSQFAATTSAQLAGVMSDETGSGALVFGTSPALTTPNIGTPSAGTLTNCDGYPEALIIAVGDETTVITTGTGKTTFRMPYAFTLTGVRASLATADNALMTVDINEGGTTVLSTKLTIDSGEKTSTTAATAAVISDSALADDAEMSIDVDGAGTAGVGLKVALLGYQS